MKEADSEEDVSGGAATPTRTPTVVTIHSGDSNDEDGGIDSVEAQQPEDANTARTTQPRTDAAVVETDGDDGAKKSLSGSNKRQRGESSGGQVSRRGRPGRRPSAKNLDSFARALWTHGEFTSNKEAIRRKMGSGWSVKRIDGFYEKNEIELDRRRRELGQGAQQGEHATAVTKNQKESDIHEDELAAEAVPAFQTKLMRMTSKVIDLAGIGGVEPGRLTSTHVSADVSETSVVDSNCPLASLEKSRPTKKKKGAVQVDCYVVWLAGHDVAEQFIAEMRSPSNQLQKAARDSGIVLLRTVDGDCMDALKAIVRRDQEIKEKLRQDVEQTLRQWRAEEDRERGTRRLE